MISKIIFLTGLAAWIIGIIYILDYVRKHNMKLCKSKENRVLCGVCGGLGEFLKIDPNIVRVIWVIMTFCGGSGIAAYIIATILMPMEKNNDRIIDQQDYKTIDN